MSSPSHSLLLGAGWAWLDALCSSKFPGPLFHECLILWHTLHTTLSRLQVEKITFLYKVKKGAAGASFGLNVAMMAGLPHPVIARASSIADSLARYGRFEEAATVVGTGVLASAPVPSGRAGGEGVEALEVALPFVRHTLYNPSTGEQSVAAEHLAAMSAAHR